LTERYQKMPNLLRSRVTQLALLIPLVGLAPGCTHQDYQLAEVEGQLIIKGQPGNKVHIEFIPDTGVPGPTSAADSDEQGKFTLHVMSRDGTSPAGAAVGSHRVTLSDRRLSESPDGRGVPIRFGQEYTLSGTTPLKQEVKPGPQAIPLQVP
jgi:hypothetical protein